MTSSLESFPRPEEIDTPWPPQTIVWRYNNPSVSADTPFETDFRVVSALKEQAADPSLTHIVREVNVYTDIDGRRSPSLHPVSKIQNDLEIVDDQFRQLQELTSIRVADTAWHVFADPAGRTRVLARVEIIDGISRRWPLSFLAPEGELTPDELALLQGLESGVDWYFDHATGRQLVDIVSSDQFILGTPRTNPLAERAFYLVDIEPRIQRYPSRPDTIPLPITPRGERI